MTALDYILNGLEAELQLERELGVRSFECDRSVLAPIETAAPVKVLAPPPAAQVLKSPAADLSPVAPPQRAGVKYVAPDAPAAAAEPAAAAAPATQGGKCEFVFLHEKPLSPKGVEMMAKITAALKKTDETAPVVTAEPLPQAAIYVVLGSLALRKWFPGVKAAPGMWVAEGGKNILVTYSPEYILRFGTVTPAVEKIKKEMWTSLKAVAQRAAQTK